MTTRRQAMVAMSGGVDSSVAAARMVAAGHDVVGVTLKLWGGESDSGCCSVTDVEDARRVAAQLGIPHYTFNLAEDFDAAVVEPYVDAHAAGRTPNPCIECNRSIKFGRLLERATALGFDRLVTGHHARIAGPAGHSEAGHSEGPRRLRRGLDRAKDQSYVLYMLGQAELSRLLLPVGELRKADVRAEAAALGLRTADKPESMEVCFITRGGREDFLRRRGAMTPGRIIDLDGEDLGTHDGSAAFTIGQRRGLQVAAGTRRYVLDVEAATGTVTIGPFEALLRDEVPVTDLTFVAGPPPFDEVLMAQVRAHATPVLARLDTVGKAGTVRFESPQPRVAPGQIVALYRGDELVGGGTAAA